jgi:hypothetical protein
MNAAKRALAVVVAVVGAACSGTGKPPGDPSDAALPSCSAPPGLLAPCAAGLWGWAGDQRTGAPIAGVTVSARRGEGLRVATTGVDGRYGLCDLDAGEWELDVALAEVELVFPIVVGAGARAVGVAIDRGDVRVVEPRSRLEGAGDPGPDRSDPARKLPGGAETEKRVFPPLLERCRL